MRAGGPTTKEPSRTEETEVRAAAAGFVEAWNAHDMEAFAELFTEDADFVNVIGLWWRGRPEIRRAHEALHATRMRNSRLETLETSVRFLRPDVAIVHERWRLSGDTGLGEEPLPPRKGILTHVVEKAGGRWRISASQNTDVLDLPNVPTSAPGAGAAPQR